VTVTLTRATDLPAPLSTPGLTEAASRAIGEWRGDPDWVSKLRTKGWEAWETIPMPTVSTEGWRRTNLRFLQLDEVVPGAAARSVALPNGNRV
jgi:Fe-S cluster assembly protein SufD